MQIEYRPIAALIPYAGNSRQHSEAQVAQIAASIQAFGWTTPILVDGANGIIAGHGRLLAAQQLAWQQVPVIELKQLTELQQQAYRLADNQLAANAEWDEALLKVALQTLQAADFDLSLTGFSTEELSALLTELSQEESPTAADELLPDPLPSPVSQLGDCWLLGAHRLLCGDATDPAVLAQLMDGEQAAMAFTDPPYNVNYQGRTQRQGRHSPRPIINDNLGEAFTKFLTISCRQLLQYTEGAVYICMGAKQLDQLQQAFQQAGGQWSTFIIWVKNRFTLGRADYQRQYEVALYGWRAGAKHFWCGDRDQGDVWFFDKPLKNDLHPTMKPVPLVERALNNSSRPHDLVLDLFAGSGTTLIAAEKTQRRARLVELDPHYVDVIIQRWQTLTGQTARRQADHRCFDELAAAS
ncbi:site-specific DNA-methyltransferase [unidentified bacterial endosymbiont]|uniref:site-specific DNA-methyltransferase n=1 Tax=unidentified bacterial endosymbiont TaxID=2355 RepID=UPI00209E75EB|nr:site-specific DNA-methyltransferase [unidentified bacterial endosymbiont]